MSINDAKLTSLKIKENEPLKLHTSFKIGGPARYYAEASKRTELKKLLQFARDNNLKYQFIGGGTNLLISDKGYDGLIIKLLPGPVKINQTEVKVTAGTILATVLNRTIEAGLIGMEFAAGIPGTVGGAIKGNAGTYGEAMEKIVKEVHVLDENLEYKKLTKSECNFSYRNSIFKNQNNNYLITDAVLELQKADPAESKKTIQERIVYRTKSQPYGCASAGCTFKNLEYTGELEKKLIELGWEIPLRFKEFKKVPTAWVIEQLDLKGKTIGGAAISDKHGNYIINAGNATADDVIQLISFVKQQVRDKIGVQLDEEVRYLGFE